MSLSENCKISLQYFDLCFVQITENKELRICSICTSNEVEDEMHFITTCTAYGEIRQKLYNYISTVNCNFLSLSNKNKLIWLMICEDDEVIKRVSQYIFDSFEIRKSIL